MPGGEPSRIIDAVRSARRAALTCPDLDFPSPEPWSSRNRCQGRELRSQCCRPSAGGGFPGDPRQHRPTVFPSGSALAPLPRPGLPPETPPVPRCLSRLAWALSCPVRPVQRLISARGAPLSGRSVSGGASCSAPGTRPRLPGRRRAARTPPPAPAPPIPRSGPGAPRGHWPPRTPPAPGPPVPPFTPSLAPAAEGGGGSARPSSAPGRPDPGPGPGPALI